MMRSACARSSVSLTHGNHSVRRWIHVPGEAADVQMAPRVHVEQALLLGHPFAGRFVKRPGVGCATAGKDLKDLGDLKDLKDGHGTEVAADSPRVGG